MINILVIGSGGREHALIYALNKSPSADKIYILSGNGGINKIAQSVNIPVNDFAAIADFCKLNDMGLAIIGGESPLVDGITDALEADGIKVFGPSKEASQIEGSKQFMKDIAAKYKIPTAEYETFTDAESAKKYVRTKGTPIVVKTDGLAAGKGVTVAMNEDEAITAIDEMFGGKFGDAGNKLVIEEFLEGEEVSFFAICDGKNAIAFGSAQDHKAVGEGDTGANTGGMGTYSPAPIVTSELHDKIMQDIINPVVKGLADDNIPYKGVLFAGIMVDKNGEPKLLEFNIRFGDPECQVLMPRLESDIVPILLAAAEGDIGGVEAKFSDKTALCVVMAANGYPASYQKNTVINNLDEAEKRDDIIIFHAGTKFENGKFFAIGGRVFGVTATANNVLDAQTKAYAAVDIIDWQDGFCRRDIGWRAIEKLKSAS